MSGTEASYEVCLLVGSRWEIHARYPVTGAAVAIEEAKQLEQSVKATVKVVREVYEAETGLYKQSIVYKSAGVSSLRGDPPAAAKKPYKARSYRRPAGSADDDDDLDDLFDEGGFDEPAQKRRAGLVDFFSFRRRPAVIQSKKPKAVTFTGLFIRIAAFIMAALFVAAALTALMPAVAPELAVRDLAVIGGGQTSVLFVVFVAAFLLTFGLLAFIVLPGLEVVRPPRRRRAPPPSSRAKRVARRLPKPDYSLLQTPAVEAEPPQPPPTAEVPPEPEEIPPEEPEPEAAAPLLSPAGQQQKLRMMTFLVGAIEAVKAVGPIDPFSRFGINLYVAGAVGALATTQAIDDADARIILTEGVVTLGTPWEMAGKFAENADSYLMQPRYLEMYEAGRRAMMAFLDGDDEGPAQLTAALDAWRNPVRRDEQTGPLAVMFTDIVGSTNMTVTVGDDAAQYVVRTHNRIVRSALANFGGREIKHTGDGIMASFATVSNAVEAAVEMQRRVAANNAAEGDIPLHLRIGINAGEPVIEDDDLFGVTVQLAARLCAAAESDQVVVSEVVRGLCSGKDIPFKPLGIREMKGFKEPVPAYEVAWRRVEGEVPVA